MSEIFQPELKSNSRRITRNVSYFSHDTLVLNL